jgi:integrase
MSCPATPAMKLTTTSIKTLTLPAGANDKTFFDDELPGFGVRLRAGGSTKLIVQYDLGGKTRRITLGATALLDLGEARKRARQILAARALGHDPAAEKQDRARAFMESFGALLPRYLAFKRTELRPRSYRETERHLRQYAKPLHSRPVASIDRRTIAALLATLTEKNGPTAAKCARASLGGYFTWLLREGLVDTNCVAFTNKPVEHGARTRVLDDGELREIWEALEGAGQYENIVRLLVLTAARRAEIGDLSWDEVDLAAAVIELPAARMKGGQPHTIPLSAPALAILAARQPNGRGFVFGRGRAGFVGWSSAKRALDARIAAARKAAGIAEPMPAWVLHDLRRLASTVMHDRLGVAPHIVEALLAHVGHKAGVAGTYNRAAYAEEKRRALERWTAWVDEVVTGKQPAKKVIKLR